ncbi:MAG: type II toxin-antitoxin system PemK/MazF family toxin [Patescibacteria group bacterium]
MAMVRHPSRFGVYLVNLDPTVGREIRKTRPCVVISPDELNYNIGTVIVAPMTTAGKAWATRIPCQLKGKRGFVVLDQIRTIDKRRLVKDLGKLRGDVPSAISRRLMELFAV